MIFITPLHLCNHYSPVLEYFITHTHTPKNFLVFVGRQSQHFQPQTSTGLLSLGVPFPDVSDTYGISAELEAQPRQISWTLDPTYKCLFSGSDAWKYPIFASSPLGQNQ